MKFLRKLRSLFRKDKLDAEMTEEMRYHVELQTELNLKAGMSPKEARYAALRQFGNVASLQEQVRAARSWVWLEQVWQDLLYAVRSLWRSPGFTLTVVLTLALGLGVNCALFSVFNAVALRSLPLKHSEELVNVVGQNELGSHIPGFSYPDYLDLRNGQRSVTALSAWTEAVITMEAGEVKARSFMIKGGPAGALAYLPLQLVSQNFFDVVGVDMALGRGFRPEEGREPGANPVIVLQHGFWEQQFHGDPNVLGKTIKLQDRVVFTVIGVAAREFVGTMPAPPIGWVPVTMLDALMGKGSQRLRERQSREFQIVARIPVGSAREQARAEMEVLTRRLASKDPDYLRKTGIEFEPCGRLFSNLTNWRALAFLSPLFLCFALVLLIACANVANLLLARATTRQQEIGVRLALGASCGRILRRLLMESTLVALVGGLAGLLVATWTLHAARSAIFAMLPITYGEVREWLFINLTPDHRIFAFTFLLALGAALAAGLFPALLAARTDVNAALKNDGSVFSRRSGLRHSLVVVQVAVCLTLLMATGLLVRLVIRQATFDPGLRTDNIYCVDLALLPASLALESDAAQREALRNKAAWSPAAQREALALARSLPGIKAIAKTSRAPFNGASRLTPVAVADHVSTGAAGDQLLAKFDFVSAEYFSMLGLAMTKGRAFTAPEVEGKVPLVVISEAAARRFWPGDSPLGKQLKVSSVAAVGGWVDPRQAQDQPAGAFTSYEVIGVVADVRISPWETDEAMIYLPLPEDSPNARLTLLQFAGPRATALPLTLAAASAQGVHLRLTLYWSLDDVRNYVLLPFEGTAAVGAGVGLLALALAVVGLYGVMTFVVGQRVREIGIRTALGATGDNIVGLFVRQGMRLVAIGLAVGSIGAIGVAALLSKIVIFGPHAFDPWAGGGVALLLALVSLFACWLPARRAAKVDPMAALRTE